MKIVGLLFGVSKSSGKEYTVLHTVKEFDDYQKEKSKGVCTESVYVPTRLGVKVGDEIELVYDKGFEGKAIVKDVIINKI